MKIKNIHLLCNEIIIMNCQWSWHIHFIDGIMTFVVYTDLLEQQMIPSSGDHLGRWYILIQEDDQTSIPQRLWWIS